MESGEGVVSVTCRLGTWILAWAFASFGVANAQVRTGLSDCIFGGRGPDCAEIEGRAVFSLFCTPPRPYANFYGRISWFPLRCVGPITVELEIATPPDTRFPLYIEVVPLGDPTEVCNTAVGSVVMIVYGESGDCGSLVSSEAIDITRVVPIDGLYAIRLHFFGHPEGFSPAMDCIRVTAHPIVSGLNESSWSLVKTLYR